MLEYAQGVLNVLEKNIFDKLDQDRMISASDKEEAFKILFDTDLPSEEKDIEKMLKIDLDSLRINLFGILKDICPDLFYFLFLRFDALDLKIALKEDKEIEIENEYFQKLVEYSFLEEGTIDQRVDRAYLKTRLLIAKKIKSLPLDVIKFEIDVSNLKNLIKEKKGFLKGGNLCYSDMLKLLGRKSGIVSKGLEKFLETFNLSILIEEFEKTGSEADLEKNLEKFLSNRILQREREGGGIAKVMGFFTRKINAHSNIRLIFFQKDSGISIKEIENNLLPL
jgi:hypothetical protein